MMTPYLIKILVDFVMVCLLCATIYYCFRVNRRIKVLQDSRNEFAQLITRFDATTQKAQESIAQLQTMSQKVNDSLSERLDKANFLADDLAFMIEKGNKVADKVEASSSGSISASNAGLPPKREARSSARASGRTTNQAALATEGEATATATTSSARKAAGGRKRGNAEAMINRLKSAGSKDAGEGKTSEGRATKPRRTSARLRSRAEQELYDAMKSGDEA